MSNPNIRKVQTRLNQLGYDAGPNDGVRGRKTIMAVRKFQFDKGLTVDGMVGRNTYAALFLHPSQTPKTNHSNVIIDGTPWMDEAYRVKGLHEVHNNKTIWAWLMSDGGGVGDPAKTPWCGDFVQTAMALSMTEEPIPENPYLALNWKKFGKPVAAQYGAILVFWRGSPSSWKGHVGFYVGETATHYKVLGGNQSNMVSETLIAKSRLRKDGIRWPNTALTATGKRIAVDGRGLVITTNEA